MRHPHPVLDGVSAPRARAFARGRVQDWRLRCTGPDASARLSMVPHAVIAAGDGQDATWWPCPWRHGAPSWGREHGSKVEVATRLIGACDDDRLLAVWSRPGPNEPTGSDRGWFAAVRHAAAARDVPPPSLLVVTRWGWQCLPDGTARTWKRLRERR